MLPRPSRLSLALVLAPALAAALLAFILAGAQRGQYEATATFNVQSPASDTQIAGGGTVALAELGSPDQQEGDVLQDFEHPQLLRTTSRLLGGRLSPQAVSRAISVSPYGINGVIGVTAHAGSPQLAAQIANAAVSAEATLSAALVRSLYARAAGAAAAQLRAGRTGALDPLSKAEQRLNLLSLKTLASSSSPVVQASKATPPSQASSPRPIRDAAIAALLALALGLLLVIVRAQMTAAAAARTIGGRASDARVLGRIPSWLVGTVVWPGDPDADVHACEPFRIVRTALPALRPEDRIRSVTLSGVLREAGTSSVAASLALACAEGGRRTLLVEGDLHRTGLAERFGVPAGPGFAELVLGLASIEDATRDLTWTTTAYGVSSGSLGFMPVGDARHEAVAAFSVDRLAELLGELRDSYDLVVLDTGPVPGTSEALAACAVTDAVVLCVLVGRDRREDVERTERIVERVGGGPVGHVLTGAEPLAA